MFEEKYKDGYMQIRLPKELRDNFKKVCKEKCINSSAMIRQLISQWLREQANEDIQHKRSTDI